jgi:hypothetical protein
VIGQTVQLFGNVTAGMAYDVNIDGNVYSGTPSGQLLAHITNITLGDHVVSLTTKPPTPGSATLSFESAAVTVGTGLTK